MNITCIVFHKAFSISIQSLDDHKTIAIMCGCKIHCLFTLHMCESFSIFSNLLEVPAKSRREPGLVWAAGVLPPPAAVSGAGLNFEPSLCTGYCGGEQVTPGGGRGNGEYHQSQPGINGEQSWRCALSALGAVTRPAASSSQPVSSASPRKCCIQSNLFPNIFHLSAKYIY